MRLGNFPVELRVAVLGVGPAAPQLRQLDQLGCAGGDVISVSVVVNRRQGDALDDGRGVDTIAPHFDQVLVERRSNVVDGPALLGSLKVAARRAAAAPRVGNASTPNATHCSNGAFDDVVGSAGVEAQVHLKGARPRRAQPLRVWLLATRVTRACAYGWVGVGTAET